MEEDIKKAIEHLEWSQSQMRLGNLPDYDRRVYKSVENILNELERLQKEFKAVDHECSRLEQKEIELEKENEHYKDLMYALETYYDITEEDLEKCIKEDR